MYNSSSSDVGKILSFYSFYGFAPVWTNFKFSLGKFIFTHSFLNNLCVVFYFITPSVIHSVLSFAVFCIYISKYCPTMLSVEYWHAAKKDDSKWSDLIGRRN